MPSVLLKNPHSVLAALQRRPNDVLEVRWNPRTDSDTWKDVVALAGARQVSVRQMLPAQEQGQRRGQRQDTSPGRTGSGEATVREHTGVALEVLFEPAVERGLWLALDQIQDPHNVGALFRTAAFFGVRGVVITRDRSSPLTATVYDVASGGLESVPFSIQTNLARSIEVAKQRGLWVLGTSEHAPTDVAAIDHNRRWLLVVGNEERGLRRLTLDKCDEVCRITPRGDLTSLNVSVASGVLMASLTELT